MTTVNPPVILRAAWDRCGLDERRGFLEEVSKSWDPFPCRVGSLVRTPDGRSGTVITAIGEIRSVRLDSGTKFELIRFAVSD